MRKQRGTYLWLAFLMVVAPLAGQMVRRRPVAVKEGRDLERFRQSWRVLGPITRRNLTVYPVVSGLKVDTSDFLTLDEGLASGAVRITEMGRGGNTLYRGRMQEQGPWQEGRPVPVVQSAPSVNELVLINASSRPLVLLAGEVVSGGKQNRIIGSDLVVPPKSEPLPLSVFCVEHGRWSEGAGFGAAKAIAHPSIRKEAQVSKSQSGVWESVSRSAGAMSADSPTADYLHVLSSPKAQRSFEEIAQGIESDYERELRERVGGQGAVGVIVAINGQLVWSDVFSSADLFRRYWPKLLRSYVMEAQSRVPGELVKGAPSSREAAEFLLEDHGRESVQVEPGAFRRTSISSAGYETVALEALGKYGELALLVHYNKMSTQ